LNRYPSLKFVFNNYLQNKLFENIELEYVPGYTPTAYFYDADGNEIESLQLTDMDFPHFQDLMKEHNFELRRPTLPLPTASVSEVTIGLNHYIYYGSSKNRYDEAVGFATKQTHNGQPGRLLTIHCKSLEDQLKSQLIPDADLNGFDAWIGASDATSVGNWKWLSNDNNIPTTAPEDQLIHVYSNWRQGEPNNANNREHCATFGASGWNDVDCESDASSIIVEFGPTSSALCTESGGSGFNEVHLDL